MCLENLANFYEVAWHLCDVVTGVESLFYLRPKETIKEKLESRTQKGSESGKYWYFVVKKLDFSEQQV